MLETTNLYLGNDGHHFVWLQFHFHFSRVSVTASLLV